MQNLFRLIILVAFSTNFAFSQDIHFSQMKYSPLNLNPAMAGAEQNLQAVVNYRNQWSSIAFPFQTIGASFDMRFKEKRSSKGFLAAGLNLFNDQAGDIRMTTTNVSLNLAYHLRLNNLSTLGVAIQGGLGQRGINPENGTWSNQFNGSGFNTNMSSGENFEQMNFSHFDAGAGFVYHYRKNERYMRGNDQFSLTAGIAAFHLNRPSSTFLSGGEDDLAIRYTGFVNADIGISNTGLSLVPAIYYNLQGPHQELLGGTYFRIMVIEGSKITGFIKELALSYGAFYRVGDAFVNKLLIEYSNYSLGISYDINASSLATASKGRGGVEFFLRFVLPNPFGHSSKARIN